MNDFSDLIWYLEKAIEKIEKADSLVISSKEEKEQFQAALSAYEDALEQVEKLKTNMEQQ